MTSPITRRQCRRTPRSGTTAARGSIVPEATSGRNGWYWKKLSGFTTVTSWPAATASFRPIAAFKPANPAPATRIRRAVTSPGLRLAREPIEHLRQLGEAPDRRVGLIELLDRRLVRRLAPQHPHR